MHRSIRSSLANFATERLPILPCSCWVRAASGPFMGEHCQFAFPVRVGLRWGFVNILKWVQEWVKTGFWGAKKWVNTSEPTFLPTLNPFGNIDKNPFLTQFKGGGNCLPKWALRQSGPSISLCSRIFRSLWFLGKWSSPQGPHFLMQIPRQIGMVD